MPINTGARIGPYEVVSSLGAGGMGEVYRARDTQLGRDVAIKILPETFATDPDRLMRFEREARTLAALNHPHVAQVYGFEASGASRALVMELVEGEDLAQRISRGAVPIDDAIAIGRQIADALESAHEAGIVHRDLKPANVRLTRDGRAKVLDFGLAKAFDSSQSGASAAATITSPAMTQAGTILGTAAYMSPEQARGKVVDRRADIWALGCVIFEMLTGARAFDGESITDVLSAVVSKEPDWSKLPPATPPGLSRLIRRCLRKDVKTRLQSAGDARLELDDAVAGFPEVAAPAAAPTKNMGWVATLAFTAGAAIAVAAFTLMPQRARAIADAPVMRYTITLPPSLSVPRALTISPDGRWIAIAAIGPTADGSAGRPDVATMAIWLRPMDAQTFRPIAGTELAMAPAWSPDSRDLAFFVGSNLGTSLYRIAIAGGTPTRVAEVPSGIGLGAAWGSNGIILVSAGGQIYRVPETGGALTPLTTVQAGYTGHSAPSWLSGSRFLFTELGAAGGGVSGVLLRSLESDAPTRLIEGSTIARPTPQGLLASQLTVTALPIGTISAHRFDVERGTVEQPGIVLATGVDQVFGASNTGVLLYRRATAGSDHHFQWMDPKGQPIGDASAVSGSGAFNLSRDDRLIAFQEGNDILVRDLERGVTTRVVQGPGVLEPILSPDGGRLAYSKIMPPKTGIAIRPTAGGREDLVFESAQFPLTLVEDWSRDGRFLIAIQSTGQRNANRGVIIPLEGDRTPVVFADLPPGATLDEPRFSPDGTWIVYNAADSGRQQVYVTPVPPTGERWQLSTDGGAQGRWRADGRGVFYLSASGQLMEVTMTGQRPPQIGRPQMLFDTGLDMSANVDQYQPDSAGKRFLLRRPRGSAGGVELDVIVNWPTLLK